MVKSDDMHTETITPRFGDIDGLRHVNNTVIPGEIRARLQEQLPDPPGTER